MGSSPSATLFFGYYWQAGTEAAEALEACAAQLGLDSGWWGWEKLLATRAGHVDPWDNFPSGAGSADSRKWSEEHKPALDAWRKITEQFSGGVDVNSHNEYETCYYLSVKASETCASDWSAEAVKPDRIALDPAWPAMLDHWLKTFGLEAPQSKPGWYLVPDYG